MNKTIYHSDEELMWLARNMDDCTSGNTEIVMDWGNVTIKCFAGSAPSRELKSRLRDLAIDYMRLKEKEIEDQKIALACQV